MNWQKDKWKHFWVGIPLGMAILYFTLHSLPGRVCVSVYVAFSVLVFVCAMFEIFSLVTDLGFYELMDAVAGILGGVVGMIAFFFFKLLLG